LLDKWADGGRIPAQTLIRDDWTNNRMILGFGERLIADEKMHSDGERCGVN